MTGEEYLWMADNMNGQQELEVQEYLDNTTDSPADVAKWLWKKLKEYLESQ